MTFLLTFRPPTFNFDEIVPGLYLGRLPRHREDYQELKKLGVTGNHSFARVNNLGLVILNEDWELQVPLTKLEDLGFDWMHLPCPDYFAPNEEEIDRGELCEKFSYLAAVEFIQMHVQKGNKVYCHCFAGKGKQGKKLLIY